MPRILGVDIPKDKKIKIALRYIYGVGPKMAGEILNNNGIDPERKARDLKDEETSKLAKYIQSNYAVEGELRRQVSQNIRRLVEIKTYRGIRHRKGLPVRGQRTRCNARTKKGPKSRVGGKKS